VLAALPPEVRVTESTESSLELKLPSDSKMRTLQALVRCGECVLDVELATPGLQELYARLVGEAQDKR
jgi:hypothetical protein